MSDSVSENMNILLSESDLASIDLPSPRATLSARRGVTIAASPGRLTMLTHIRRRRREAAWHGPERS
jgi:hypothetical protein